MKKTSVRLLAEHKSLVGQGLAARSRYVNEAIRTFLDWDSYKEVAESGRVMPDGSPWLDAVEIGVDYKTQMKLLDPVVLVLDEDTENGLIKAAKIVERTIPRLKNKGVQAGIIRSAVQHKIYSGEGS